MGKQKPPVGKKDRQAWDAKKHWERTWHKRITFDSIVPEHIQHYRKFMVQEYKQNGFLSAVKMRDKLVDYFEAGRKDGKLTQKEVDWVKENLDSLLNVMKKQRLKKLKKK